MAIIKARHKRAKPLPAKTSEIRAEMSNGTTAPRKNGTPSPEPTDAAAPHKLTQNSTTEKVANGSADQHESTEREAANVYTKGWRRNLVEVFSRKAVSNAAEQKKAPRRRRKKKTH